jgi:hypothetical protein
MHLPGDALPRGGSRPLRSAAIDARRERDGAGAAWPGLPGPRRASSACAVSARSVDSASSTRRGARGYAGRDRCVGRGARGAGRPPASLRARRAALPAGASVSCRRCRIETAARSRPSRCARAPGSPRRASSSALERAGARGRPKAARRCGGWMRSCAGPPRRRRAARARRARGGRPQGAAPPARHRTTRRARQAPRPIPTRSTPATRARRTRAAAQCAAWPRVRAWGRRAWAPSPWGGGHGPLPLAQEMWSGRAARGSEKPRRRPSPRPVTRADPERRALPGGKPGIDLVRRHLRVPGADRLAAGPVDLGEIEARARPQRLERGEAQGEPAAVDLRHRPRDRVARARSPPARIEPMKERPAPSPSTSGRQRRVGETTRPVAAARSRMPKTPASPSPGRHLPQHQRGAIGKGDDVVAQIGRAGARAQAASLPADGGPCAHREGEPDGAGGRRRPCAVVVPRLPVYGDVARPPAARRPGDRVSACGLGSVPQAADLDRGTYPSVHWGSSIRHPSPPRHHRYANHSVSFAAGRGGGEGWRMRDESLSSSDGMRRLDSSVRRGSPHSRARPGDAAGGCADLVVSA